MLNQHYKETLSILLENLIDFLLAVAYAMDALGFPRATADLEIFLGPDVEMQKRCIKP